MKKQILDRVGTIIYWEPYKYPVLDEVNKLTQYKQEFVLEDKYKIHFRLLTFRVPHSNEKTKTSMNKSVSEFFDFHRENMHIAYSADLHIIIASVSS